MNTDTYIYTSLPANNLPTVTSASIPHVRLEVIAEDPALLPKYAHSGDAGMDLRAGYNGVVKPGETKAVGTGVRVAVPSGLVALIHPRSGLASKGITVANSPGTIDSGFRGDLKVLLYNHSKQVFNFNKGDRIAQMVIQPYYRAVLTEVETFSEDSDRGENGFGSTGVK